MGGGHCADLVVAQTDFDKIERLQAAGDWGAVGAIAAAEANRLKAAGADFFIIACNTVHAAMPWIEAAAELPCLHIVDPTARAVVSRGCKTVGLIGSGYTMNGTYFTGRLSDRYGLKVLLPDADGRETVHRALYGELVRGVFRPETKKAFDAVISGLAERGAEAVIMGCTEFGLLLDERSSPLPLIDTAVVHALAAVDFALQEE